MSNIRREPANETNYAVCIAYPGITSDDIVLAAQKHNIVVLDIENYDRGKDYNVLLKAQNTINKAITVCLMFVFPKGQSMLMAHI